MTKSAIKAASQPHHNAGAARVGAALSIAGVLKTHKRKSRRFRPGTRALKEIR